MLHTNSLTAFVSKFERGMRLTEVERSALAAVPTKVVELNADEHIVREGDRPSRSAIVIEGLVCTSKVEGGGKRQITAFHLPGDMPDLMSLHLSLVDSDVSTVTPSVVGFLDHGDLRALCAKHPRIAASLWRATLIDAAMFREWVVNVGQRRGANRVAHLFCEVMTRMEAVGRAKDCRCSFGVTQTDLSEAMGLSTVHINRVLQDMRKQHMLSFVNGVLTIHRWDALADLADFRADYLHLDHFDRVAH